MTAPNPARVMQAAPRHTALRRRSVAEGYVAPGRRVNRPGVQFLVAVVAALALLAGRPAPAAAQEITLVALGDSLTAGFGLAPGSAFPDRLETALAERGYDVRVVNAGVSGDTTAAGLARLDWALGEDADAVIVELGGNDALRGLSPAQTRENLDTLLAQLGERDLPVLLAGMLAPRNLGSDYAGEFDTIYPDLARKHDTLLYPFFLEGVATVASLNQDDGIHPNDAGISEIVRRIVPEVEKLLVRARELKGGD